LSSELQKKTGRPADLAKREAIIDAAAASFFDIGYEATSIERVAADAGVSKVTVYNHFGGKPALLSAAVESQCEQIRSSLSLDGLAAGTIRERLAALGETFVAFLSRPEMIAFERRIAAETERDPAIGACFLDAGPRRMHALLAALMQRAAELGELDIDDPMLAAEQFASMCKGFGDLERRFGAGSDRDRDKARIAGAVDAFLRAYAP